ncbi:MAG: hypothetical protein LBN39_04225, partial [Planctomycetaceae bacterium]|nr:hypothetical protein [Planctomycetaceae bacterium]
MDFCFRRTLSAFVLFVLCFAAEAAAQTAPFAAPPVPRETIETPKLNKEPVSDTVPVQVRQAPLDPIVVFNNEGKRIIHLPQGWHLESLDDFWQFQLQQRKNAVPDFVLQEVNAEGNAVNDRAEVRFKITWTTPAGRTVQIPLGLKEGITPQPQTFRYTGSGQFELSVDARTGQYVAVVKTEETKKTEENAGPPTTEPTAETEKTPENVAGMLEFTLWFPLTRIGGDENKLSISFPQAVRSQFQLNVPAKNITATVSQRALLELKESSAGTQLDILGLKPDFELSWQKKKTETAAGHPILFVEDSLIKVQLDVKSAVYDAMLSIRSPSGEFDRFHVRLPQGATLDKGLMDRTAAVENFSWSETREIKGEENHSSLIEIRLPRKVSGKLNLRIRASQQFNQDMETRRDIEGFEILEADRQTGVLSVSIPPDRRPNWETVRWIRRSETPEIGTPTAPSEGNVPRFKFSSQPFLLRCQLIAPETRINVKPEYQVLINKGMLALTARLSYIVLGSKTEQLSVDLPGWTWSGEIKPAGTVDTVSVSQNKDGRLTIPLRAPTDGNFEIELKAYRRIPAFKEEEKDRLSIPLPKPAATWCESASAVFVPDDNVEVLPVEETSVGELPAVPAGSIGLTRQNRRVMTFRIELPERQQEPLFYRTEPEESVFAADIRYHRQKTAAAVLTQIRLNQQEHQVEQLISYDISYVPTDKLYFFIPNELEENGGIQVQLTNKILDLRKGSPEGTDIPDGGSVQFVLLPDTQFKFQLMFRYSVPPVPVERALSAPFSLSFIRPLDAQITDNRVEMLIPDGSQITLRDGSENQWKMVEPQAAEAKTAFQAVQPANGISMLFRTADRDAFGTTVIDKAWLTTRLTGTVRADHGTYRVNTSRNSIVLRLPPEAVKEKVFTYVNRKPVRAEMSAKGELTVPITAAQQNTPVAVDVMYRFPCEMTSSVQELNMPGVDSASSDTFLECEYWQVILPQNEHIINVPANWSAEYRWAWNNLFFGRVPALHRQDIGFGDEFLKNDTAPAETNQYLFSSLHPPNRSSLYVMNRAIIIFLSSACMLAVGLTVIYFPKTRYTGSLFILLVCFFAVLCYRPALVLLMLQASSFGLLLLFGAGYLYRIVYRNEKWVVPPSRVWDAEQSEVYSVVMDDESDTMANKGQEVKNDTNAEQIAAENLSFATPLPAPPPNSHNSALLLFVAMTVLSVACPVFAQTEVPAAASSVSFRRWLAPLDRIDDWPYGQGQYIQFNREQFEQWVALLSIKEPAAALPDSPFTQIILCAELESGQLVHGTGELKIRGENSSPSFPAANLPFNFWTDSLESGKDSTVRFRWSLRSRLHSPQGTVFDFTMPPCPAAELRLTLPETMTPSLQGGIVLPPSPGTRDWRIFFGRQNTSVLTILPNKKQTSKQCKTGVRQTLVYNIAPQGTDVRSSFVFDKADVRISGLSLDLDPSLRIVEILYGDQRVAWTPDYSDDLPSGTGITVDLSGVPKGEQRDLTLRAIAAADERNPRQLPRIRIVSDNVFWQETRCHIVVQHPCKITEVDAPAAIRISPGTSAERTDRDVCTFQFFEPDAAVSVFISDVQPAVSYSSAAQIILGSSDIQGTVTVDAAVGEGSCYELTLPLPPQWNIDSVKSIYRQTESGKTNDGNEIAFWEVQTSSLTSHPSSLALTLQLKQPLLPKQTLRFRIIGRCPFDTEKEHTIGQISPLAPEIQKQGTHFLAVQLLPPFHLQYRTPVPPPEQDTAANVRLSQSFSDVPQGTVLLLDTASRKIPFAVSRLKPNFAADITETLTVHDNELTLSCDIQCRPVDSAVSQIYVRFGAGRQVIWNSNIGAVQSRILTAEEQEELPAAELVPDGSEMWEIRLMSPQNSPFRINASATLPLSENFQVPLAAVSAASPQIGKVLLKSPYQLEYRIVNTHLRSVPVAAPEPAQYQTVRAAFEYGVSEQLPSALVLQRLRPNEMPPGAWIEMQRLDSQYEPEG